MSNTTTKEDSVPRSRVRDFGARLRPSSLLVVVAMIATACDPAPASPPTADALVARYGIDADVAQPLVAREPLRPDEIETLARTGKRDVLVLLMAHPSTPPTTLAAFASFPDDAVRASVAGNVSTPTATLRFMRAPGRPGIVNRALAMNASTPADLLLEMRAKGEAGDVSLAANPALPADVMRSIHGRGDEVAKRSLARNPALPQDLRDALTRDESQAVRDALAAARR